MLFRSGSNTGTNSGTQSGTVDDITPPSNNNSNSGGSQSSGGNTSKPSTGSSNSGSSSSGSNNSGSSDNGFTPITDDMLEAAGITTPSEDSMTGPDGVADGSGTYVPDLEDRLDGTQGTISW